MSEIGNKQVDDGTDTGTMVRACVKAANKQVDDGTGTGTMVRACVKTGKNGANKQVDDGTGTGTVVRACVTHVDDGTGTGTGNTVRACITCKWCREIVGVTSAMCNQCQLAVFFGK
jgi:hypothetical protein